MSRVNRNDFYATGKTPLHIRLPARACRRDNFQLKVAKLLGLPLRVHVLIPISDRARVWTRTWEGCHGGIAQSAEIPSVKLA